MNDSDVNVNVNNWIIDVNINQSASISDKS